MGFARVSPCKNTQSLRRDNHTFGERKPVVFWLAGRSTPFGCGQRLQAFGWNVEHQIAGNYFFPQKLGLGTVKLIPHHVWEGQTCTNPRVLTRRIVGAVSIPQGNFQQSSKSYKEIRAPTKVEVTFGRLGVIGTCLTIITAVFWGELSILIYLNVAQIIPGGETVVPNYHDSRHFTLGCL